jgi:nitroreductase
VQEVIAINEFYDMLLKRRTIRAFRPEMIPDDIMNKIITAGKYAPSAMGQQNRHFTVIKDQTLLNDVVKATEKAGGEFVPGHTPFYSAPAVIILSAPASFKFNREDCACAIQNMMLAACSFGIGSCYICAVLPGLRDSSIMDRLKLPANYVPYGSVSFGYPAASAPEAKARRTDDVTFLP